MTDFSSIEHFLETSGPDKGRIKDVDVAWEVALSDAAWRDEAGGQPMLPPPERVRKVPVYYSDLIEQEIARIVLSKVISKDAASEALRKLHDELHDRASDPEAESEAWFAWRIGRKLLNSFGPEYGFDYETCNEIAAMPFEEAFQMAYSYLMQAGCDPDEVLAEFIE